MSLVEAQLPVPIASNCNDLQRRKLRQKDRPELSIYMSAVSRHIFRNVEHDMGYSPAIRFHKFRLKTSFPSLIKFQLEDIVAVQDSQRLRANLLREDEYRVVVFVRIRFTSVRIYNPGLSIVGKVVREPEGWRRYTDEAILRDKVRIDLQT